MKISECKNAPEWLVLAETKNADVEVSESGWVIWKGGDFLGGYFRGGYFLGGEFRGGIMMPLCKWVYGFDHDGKIKIGCKSKSLEDWQKWFDSDEEYSTKRGTEDFKKIRACFEAAKAYLIAMK